MPVARKYNPGSVIYFEKEMSDKVYIIKSGKVVLRYKSIENNYEERAETLKPGEFFGVKSALGSFPREETATAVASTDVLVLSLSEFENLAAKNLKVLMKLLQVFSNQLRVIHKQVRNYITNDDSGKADVELYKIGDFYLKNKKFDQAVYVLLKYIELYPEGEFASEAREKAKQAQKGIAISATKSQITSGNSPSASIKKQEPSGESASDITKRYYEAVSLFSQNKFEDSVVILSDIIRGGKTEKNSEFFEKSHFQLGKCYLKMDDWDNAIDKFSSYIKSYPSSNLVKEAVFNLGLAHEGLGEVEKALDFYNKVKEMQPEDQLNKKAGMKIDTLE
jgi:TolA-binding protein